MTCCCNASTSCIAIVMTVADEVDECDGGLEVRDGRLNIPLRRRRRTSKKKRTDEWHKTYLPDFQL